MSLLSIQSLPFDVLMEIAKYLNLRDSFSFSKCCTAAFDAVCYIYSHNTVLDFGSTLTPEGVIVLSDGDILELLHAHTRACHITNFALPPSFSKFAELEAYMRTYLCTTFNSTHPRGQVCRIQFPRDWGTRGSSTEQTALHYYDFDRQFDDYGILSISGGYFGPPKQMWSTVDLDRPWKDPDPHEGCIPPEYELEERMDTQ